jgi:hypothetical protein
MQHSARFQSRVRGPWGKNGVAQNLPQDERFGRKLNSFRRVKANELTRDDPSPPEESGAKRKTPLIDRIARAAREVRDNPASGLPAVETLRKALLPAGRTGSQHAV